MFFYVCRWKSVCLSLLNVIPIIRITCISFVCAHYAPKYSICISRCFNGNATCLFYQNIYILFYLFLYSKSHFDSKKFSHQPKNNFQWNEAFSKSFQCFSIFRVLLTFFCFFFSNKTVKKPFTKMYIRSFPNFSVFRKTLKNILIVSVKIFHWLFQFFSHTDTNWCLFQICYKYLNRTEP
jgi:hypothetical protein